MLIFDVIALTFFYYEDLLRRTNVQKLSNFLLNFVVINTCQNRIHYFCFQAPQITTNQRCPPCQPSANIKSTKQLGAAAGFFAPVSSMKRHKPDMMMRSIKASMVDTHVPSQKGNESSK